VILVVGVRFGVPWLGLGPYDRGHDRRFGCVSRVERGAWSRNGDHETVLVPSGGARSHVVGGSLVMIAVCGTSTLSSEVDVPQTAIMDTAHPGN
jgi:hypothetical protein